MKPMPPKEGTITMYSAKPKGHDMSDPELQRVTRILADILYYANDQHTLPAKEIEQEASEFDVTLYQLRKAKDVLRVQSHKQTGVEAGPWLWSLPSTYKHPKPEPSSTAVDRGTSHPELSHSYMKQSPCWGCGNMILFRQTPNSTTERENDGRIEYGYCESCTTKEKKRHRAQLVRELEGTERTLKHITAYDPNDPQAVPLSRSIEGLRKKLGIPGPEPTATKAV